MSKPKTTFCQECGEHTGPFHSLGNLRLCPDCYVAARGFEALPLDPDGLPPGPFPCIQDAVRWSTAGESVSRGIADLVLAQVPVLLLERAPQVVCDWLMGGSVSEADKQALDDAVTVDLPVYKHFAAGALHQAIALQERLRQKLEDTQPLHCH